MKAGLDHAYAMALLIGWWHDQAWDENVDPFTNTVRVTIARLRGKLGQPDIIHTTPGLGYRITETRPPQRSVSAAKP